MFPHRGFFFITGRQITWHLCIFASKKVFELLQILAEDQRISDIPEISGQKKYFLFQ
jgi:hypothetical protein